MKVTIGDLDYYYSKNKVNAFNPDVMKISSFHKQSGDAVTLVVTEDDIYRPYDLYYIIKEDKKSKMPPLDFFLNPHVRWWGKEVSMRINWKMTDAMLGCRPDYQIYPEHNTKEERAEQVRFFNNNAKLLPKLQNWSNTYKNKYVIVTDKTMWYGSKKDILYALQQLIGIKRVSFLEPIWAEKLLGDEELTNAFLSLSFSPGSKIVWSTIKNDSLDKMIDFYLRFKKTFPQVSCGRIEIDWSNDQITHWEDKTVAIKDFELLKRNIIKCKRHNMKVLVRMPRNRFETPYYEVFETIANWTKKKFEISWLEYLTLYVGKFDRETADYDYYGNHPQQWTELFRDLLRQTYQDSEFLLLQMKDNHISRMRIPWNIGEEQFKLGL